MKAWFEPILDVGTMRVVAAEAVPRWESPQHGTLMGTERLGPMLQPDAEAAMARAVAQSALASGGLWRQMGWRGHIVIPLGSALLRSDDFWPALSEAIKKNGVTGTTGCVIPGSAFTTDGPRAAFAIARAAMDGVGMTIRVTRAADLDAIGVVAACNVVTCPAGWVDGQPDALNSLRDIAGRIGATVGVTGVTDAAMLAKLGTAGIRRAQGPAIGLPASAADTYEAHLAPR